MREPDRRVGADTGGEDGLAPDRVDARLMEPVDDVGLEDVLDVRAVEAGLFPDLAQRAIDDPLVAIEPAGDALPDPGVDAAARAPDEQDLRPTGGIEPEQPAGDEIGSDGAQSRSYRSTGSTKTVAPPTSTSSG
jgi:hypothetical protein